MLIIYFSVFYCLFLLLFIYFFTVFLQNKRREWDSNPRYPFEVYTLSRRAPSTTRPPLLTYSQPAKLQKNINYKSIYVFFSLIYKRKSKTIFSKYHRKSVNGFLGKVIGHIIIIYQKLFLRFG